VVDTGNHRIQKFTSAGVFLTKWGAFGSGNGQFNQPFGVAVDAAGNVYVPDTSNHRVQKFNSAGGYLAQWGSNGTANGQFNLPFGVATDSAGNVYVVDNGNSRVQKFSPAGFFQAKWGTSGSGNGQFNFPFGIAIDGDDNVYVSDVATHRLQKFSTAGAFLGAWGGSGSGNGQFNQPYGVAASPLGTLFVAERAGRRIQQFSLARLMIGLGNGGDGYVQDIATAVVHSLLGWQQVGWASYNSANGETRPVFCDVDGDRKDELVIGLGSGGAGWLQVKNDPDTGFGPVTWIQVDFPSYNAANGETWPACGDIDGDGRDEIVVGLGNGGGGWVKVFDDLLAGFAPMPGTPATGGWIRVPWSGYNSADGSVHPAVGNLDSDARAEIAFGLGPGSIGWVHIRDDHGVGFANLAGTPAAGGWLQLGWTAYQVANGETWPAIGDLDGDNRGELVLGLGNGGSGWLRVFMGEVGGFAPAPGTPVADGWVRIDWAAYNSAVGSSYPAIGDLDGNGASELIIGLGTYTAAGGFMEIRESLADGLVHRAWARVAWVPYNGANGLTRPTVSR